MLDVTAQDGRGRATTWQPSTGGSARTPGLIWPVTPSFPAPPSADLLLGRAGSFATASPAKSGPVLLASGGTWFYPEGGEGNPAGGHGNPTTGSATPSANAIATLVPAIQPAPSTKPQTILASSELAVLHDAAGWATNPKSFLTALIQARNEATQGRLLWAPALGSPNAYAVYAYLGVDLFDASPLLLAAVRGEVLTTEGTLSVAQAAALHGDSPAAWDAHCILQHNIAAAKAELALIQHHIREGTLRGLAERRAYTAARLVETLRLFDREHSYLESVAPHQRAGQLPCMTVESVWMPEVESFRRRFRDAYATPTAASAVAQAAGLHANDAADILVLIPCSARKPYKLSRSHKHYIRALEDSGIRSRVHEVMVTSPLGLVPRELEELYPANAYDIPVTGHWMLDEQDLVRTQLKNLLAKGQYKHVIAHVGNHTLDALRDLMPAGFHDTVRNHPTAFDDTKRLAETLRGIAAADPKHLPGWPARRLHDLAALASYQFGPAVASDLVAGAHTFGRPPFVKLEGPEGQRATTTQERGQLSLTMSGAALLAKHKTHRVMLKDFDLKRTSSLFAVGIESADADIRVGDEVVLLRGDEVKGGGTAMMSGADMTHLARGIAVAVRHLIASKEETSGKSGAQLPPSSTPPSAPASSPSAASSTSPSRAPSSKSLEVTA